MPTTGYTRAAHACLSCATMAVVAVLDQATKAWARLALAGGPKTFVDGVMDLSLTYNTGAAFSVGQGAGVLFALVALAAVAAVFYVVWRHPEMPPALVVSLSCVAGGGLGNMVDRIAFGKVTDFLRTTFVDFPVFNVADAFITVGVAVSVVLLWRWDARRETPDRRGAKRA